MSESSADAGSISGQGPEPASACDVYYLRIELHVRGFRWVIAKSGTVEPVLAGAVFSTEYAAKLSGRAGLDRFLAQQNSRSARCLEVSSVGRIPSDR